MVEKTDEMSLYIRGAVNKKEEKLNHLFLRGRIVLETNIIPGYAILHARDTSSYRDASYTRRIVEGKWLDHYVQ
jgi:hypothetical protein